jgi:hypothetical protein
MRGDVVLVRAYGGEALRRLVWEIIGDMVMVVNPDYYDRALQGDDIRPIGFPVEDVFEFSLDLYEQLRSVGKGAPKNLWSKASKYAQSN